MTIYPIARFAPKSIEILWKLEFNQALVVMIT